MLQFWLRYNKLDKMFDNDAKGAVINSGHMADILDIQIGLRQGCPLSIFFMHRAAGCHCKTDNEDFKGIPIFDKECQGTLFADDSTFALDGTFISFNGPIKIFEAFKSISSLKINNKTSLYYE